ncbi:putative inorganic phosphate cotransporter isoform X2 [Thrips palmi]|uniref:Inorganic phosphate cotransporter isoform X2 n=1 Tax=Thrips palmi TaxID=161013 RepID=A0A6P8ZJ62_THRPL|nr:putative inorganic phosphate cotransporter isoform X2 [Thrips palmi]
MPKNCLAAPVAAVFGPKWMRQRYVLVVMGMLGMINAFTMRACLNVAITQMTAPPSQPGGENKTSDDSCPFDPPAAGSDSSGSAVQKEYPFNWDSEQQGLILGAFYIGYIFTHIPGGQIADRYGGKHTLGLGILATAICTFLTPAACKLGDVAGAVIVRILMGLGEGVTFPAIFVLLAKWAPERERSLMGTIVLAGPQVGTLVGNALSGFFLDWFVWETTFYVYGGLGLAWWFFWCFLCYSDPNQHPFIGDKELKYLNDNVTGLKEQDNEKEHVKTPWKSILTSMPVLALITTEVGHDWGFYTMVTDLPKYMSDVQHFKISSNGTMSALPFICMWISSMVLSATGDWITSKRVISNTLLRKIFTTIGSVGPGAFLLWASYAGCNKYFVVALFCIGMTTMGAFYPGMRVNALDLSPRHAGTIGALMNGTGALAGVAAPYAIGLIAPNGLMSEWQTVFIINFAIMGITNVAFIIWGSGERQWWDDPHGKPPGHVEDPEDDIKAVKGPAMASTAM